MTPKEKAEQLKEDFTKLNRISNLWRGCALRLIEEIRYIAPYETYKDTLQPYDGAELSTNYWDEVKDEVNAL